MKLLIFVFTYYCLWRKWHYTHSVGSVCVKTKIPVNRFNTMSGAVFNRKWSRCVVVENTLGGKQQMGQTERNMQI